MLNIWHDEIFPSSTGQLSALLITEAHNKEVLPVLEDSKMYKCLMVCNLWLAIIILTAEQKEYFFWIWIDVMFLSSASEGNVCMQ